MLYTIFFCIFLFYEAFGLQNDEFPTSCQLLTTSSTTPIRKCIILFAFVHIIVNQDYELMKVGFFVKCWQRLQVSFFFVAELTTEKKAVITTSTSLPVPNWFLYEHYISYSKFWYTCTLLFSLKLLLDFTAWHFCWRMLSSS